PRRRDTARPRDGRGRASSSRTTRAATRPALGPAAGRTARLTPPPARREGRAARKEPGQVGERTGLADEKIGRARWWCRPSAAQRVLPDDGEDVGEALNHPDLFRQFVKLHDYLGVAFVERAGDVGAFLKPPAEELGRQIVLLADGTEHLVAVGERVSHRVKEHAIELLEGVRALGQTFRI